MRTGGCGLGFAAPHSEARDGPGPVRCKTGGAGKEGRQGAPSMCLELWVHCLVVYERPACVARGGPPRPPPTRPLGSCGPHPPPVPPAFPFSLLHSRTLAPTLSFVFSPCPPTPPAPPVLAALALPLLSLLLSVLSLLSLQLPADRVRQVHPVLRAPGPPSTSNQIPLFLGDLPFQACLDGCSVT